MAQISLRKITDFRKLPVPKGEVIEEAWLVERMVSLEYTRQLALNALTPGETKVEVRSGRTIEVYLVRYVDA